MELRDSNLDLGLEPRVSHWAFDRFVGRISACDGYGNLVMEIPAGQHFGARLAAAFSSPAAPAMSYVGTGPRPPAFPP